MEGIRPDQDELRGSGYATERTGKRRQASGSAGGRVAVWLVLLALVGAVGYLIFQQQQLQAALNQGVLKMEDWESTGRLAIARIEGQLQETGNSLEATSEGTSSQVGALNSRLATLDKGLADTKKTAATAQASTGDNASALKALRSNLETVREAVDSHSRSLSAQNETLEQLRGALDSQQKVLAEFRQMVSDLGSTVNQRGDTISSLEQKIQGMTSELGGIGSMVDQKVARLKQESELARSELATRIRQAAPSGGDTDQLQRSVNRLSAQVNDMQSTLAAIDASRAQITSRLMRLSNEVDSLRQ